MKDFEPKIISFCCNWCSYAGADLAGVSRFQYPPNTRIIRVMCSARIDPMFIFDSFLEGADGVLVTGCHLQDCHYIDGNLETLRRYNLLREVLHTFNLEPERIRLEWVSASEGDRFASITKEFVDKIRELGPPSADFKKKIAHVRNAFDGRRTRLTLGLARKKIKKGADEKEYTEKMLRTAEEEIQKSIILATLEDKGPMSGEDIASELNMTPEDVSKYIKGLKKLVEEVSKNGKPAYSLAKQKGDT